MLVILDTYLAIQLKKGPCNCYDILNRMKISAILAPNHLNHRAVFASAWRCQKTTSSKLHVLSHFSASFQLPFLLSLSLLKTLTASGLMEPLHSLFFVTAFWCRQFSFSSAKNCYIFQRTKFQTCYCH